MRRLLSKAHYVLLHLAAAVNTASTFESRSRATFRASEFSVRSKEARHPVVRKINSIRTLVDQNGYRSVRVRDVLNHLTHDDRIAHYETYAPRRCGAVTLAQDFAEVEACELH